MGGKRQKTPDYAAAAREQGEANKEAAIASSMLSNPNINNPYGTRRVEYAQGPDGNWIPTVTDAFSDVEQQKFDANNALELGLLDTAQTGLGRVDDMMGTPFSMGGIKDWRGIDQRNLPGRQFNDPTQGIHQRMSLGHFEKQNLPGVDNLSTEGLTEYGDYSVGGLDNYADAIRELGGYRLGQERSNLEADLAARGFTPGTEGYDDALRAMGQKENDFELQALLSAGQEQDRINRGLMAQRGQEFGEAKDIYSAQDRDYNRDLGTKQWLAGEMAGRRNQDFSQNMQRAGLSEARRAAAFGEQDRMASLQNALRQSQIQEQAYLRQLPLNEINALRTGSQAMLPQFQQFTGQNIQAAPTFNAAVAQGQHDLANAQNQFGWGDLIGAGLGAAGQAQGFGNLFRFG